MKTKQLYLQNSIGKYKCGCFEFIFKPFLILFKLDPLELICKNIEILSMHSNTSSNIVPINEIEIVNFYFNKVLDQSLQFNC